jgi:hypothetical protein
MTDIGFFCVSILFLFEALSGALHLAVIQVVAKSCISVLPLAGIFAAITLFVCLPSQKLRIVILETLSYPLQPIYLPSNRICVTTTAIPQTVSLQLFATISVFLHAVSQPPLL